VFSADAVKAYKHGRQPNQSQNATAAAVNNTDSSSDRTVKSVVCIDNYYRFYFCLMLIPFAKKLIIVLSTCTTLNLVMFLQTNKMLGANKRGKSN